MMEKEVLIPEDIEKAIEDLVDKSHQIILYNDDVNNFDYVILVLRRILGHTSEQAEQIANIVHTVGECSIKQGSYNTLRPICATLNKLKLDAELH